MNDQLDEYDNSILKAVSTDGRITVTELANRINLSKSPTQARLKRLENAGYITGYTAQLNPKKLGLAHIAFVEVKLADTRESALEAYNIKEVEQCHMIAGSFDYLLKVRSCDMQQYRSVLGDQISALPNVSHTSTHVVMESVKEGTL